MTQHHHIGKFVIGMLLLLVLVLLASNAPVRAADEGSVPEQAAMVLGRRCLSCHNAEKKAGKLDLSTRATALAAGVFVLQGAEKSRLVQRVTAGTMPPNGKLPEKEIALLRQWIAEGAVYPRERLEALQPARKPPWSFQPVKRPVVPKTQFDALATNSIDHFLFAEMAKRWLRPSLPASKLALLRRVTIDLTGLPPTPEEVRAFLADKSPNAYEKVVERLLASPDYGERWGRHWLDVARYGESHGYEQNHIRPNAWPYRDYVIRAFNEDRPYDRFVTEQLAGDIVGQGNPDIEVATGFLVAGIHDTVGIQTVEGTRQQRANDLDDMVATTGATFLGLTANCAKCHDHKFDPIPSRDYYRMAAVFADVRHGERALSPKPQSAAQQREAERLKQAIQEATEALAALDAQARGSKPINGAKLRPPVNTRRNVEEFAPIRARFVRFTILATQDGSQPCLDELQIFGPESDRNLALASNGGKALASSLLPGYAIHQIAHLNDGVFGNAHSWISNEPGKGWAQIELPESRLINKVVWARDAEGQFKDRLAAIYRIEVSDDARAWKTVASSEDHALDPATPPPGVLLQNLSAAERERRAQLAAKLERLKQQFAPLAAQQMAYVGNFTEPDPIYVLKRGDVMQRGELVTPGALSQITALPSDLEARTEGEKGRRGEGEGQGRGKGPITQLSNYSITQHPTPNAQRLPPRLALAKWICDPRNPLTARVMVNRLWGQHFGRGLVGTPSDFGNNGEMPSHPELLDWLASDFMANGWKLKRVHRMMVTSYVYRQASAVVPAMAQRDGDNRYLWRMPLRRMEAEAVRDSILATSGKLDRTMGGPSFRLYQYNIVNVAIYTPSEEQGPETWRRCVYQQPARGIRDDLLGTFDCPDSSERTARRSSTTTALQALSLLNGRFVNQQADFFAARVRQSAGAKPEAQIARAFLLAFGRSPDAVEQKASLELVTRNGLPTLCRALLNANEFLYY